MTGIYLPAVPFFSGRGRAIYRRVGAIAPTLEVPFVVGIGSSWAQTAFFVSIG